MISYSEKIDSSYKIHVLSISLEYWRNQCSSLKNNLRGIMKCFLHSPSTSVLSPSIRSPQMTPSFLLLALQNFLYSRAPFLKPSVARELIVVNSERGKILIIFQKYSCFFALLTYNCHQHLYPISQSSLLPTYFIVEFDSYTQAFAMLLQLGILFSS